MMSWQNFYAGPMNVGFLGLAGSFFILVLAWTLVWKGMALWKAAHEDSKPWFVALLLVNTMGILEILYLYVFSKKSSSPAPTESPKM